MHESDQRDHELLNALQGEIPLVSTPFAVIGQMLDMSEKEVIKRTERFRRDHLVRSIAPQFDPRALGYLSALVATRVAPERVDEAAAIISAHPGVTQNYLRNNELNLWFTLYVSPYSKLGLDATIDILAREAGCDDVRVLPAIRAYRRTAAGEVVLESDAATKSRTLTPVEVDAVRLLQSELPLQPRPFDVLTRSSGMTPEELISITRKLRAEGQIRRFGAMVVPRRTGFESTAMAVWVVPDEKSDEYARQFVQHRAVSHGYLRPPRGDWPYNLYTTVHARSVDECESVINDLATDFELTQKQTLFPLREYKRSAVRFFSPETDQWESARTGEAPRIAGAANG